MDVGGVEKLLDLTIDQLSHLDKPLREFSAKYKRPEIKARFKNEGPGWAPLAESTIDRKLTSAEIELVSGGKHNRSPAKRILGTIHQIARAERTIKRAETEMATGKKRARLAAQAAKATRRLSVLKSNLEAQSRRYVGRGRFKAVSDIVEYAETESVRRANHRAAMMEAREYKLSNPGDEAGRRKIARRGQKRYKNAMGGQGMLGELANSISAKVTRDTLELFSKAFIGGIHNSGGTAGNNATIPARKFLEWTARDFDILSTLIAEFVVGG